MLNSLLRFHQTFTVEKPWIAGLLSVLLLAAGAWFAQDFRLDASSDSLVLENDEDLRYYRETREQYGSDDFLIVTYTPHGDLFAKQTLNDIEALRSQLLALRRASMSFRVCLANRSPCGV